MAAVLVAGGKERRERAVALDRHGPIQEVPTRSVEVAKRPEGPERGRPLRRARPVVGRRQALGAEAAQRLGGREPSAHVRLRAEVPLADRDAEPGMVLRDPLTEKRQHAHALVDPRLVHVARIPEAARRSNAESRGGRVGFSLRADSHALGHRVEVHVEDVEDPGAGPSARAPGSCAGTRG